MKPHDFSKSSIGIFDSGFGGLTVMRAIRTLLPNEHITYFGDTARLPYGSKSPDTILRYSQENATFLKDLGVKALVIACHTACSVALEYLRENLNIPIIGIIDEGVEEIARVSKTGQIAVLGTRATISSGVYQQYLKKKIPTANISPIPCPLFVPLIEEGYIDHPLTDLAVQEYLGPLKMRAVDAVLLACTHYPLLRTMIQKELGPDVLLVDPADTCAARTKELLVEHMLLNEMQERPQYQFYVSEDPEKFQFYGKNFLNYPIEHVLKKNLF